MRYLFILLFTIFSATAIAQPKLPDIAGSAEKGIVVLTWNCQYDGIKAIMVQRANKIATDYKNIGNVRKVGKGVQAFMDGHPGAGTNWYRLQIIFSSDLSWTSNVIKFNVDSATLADNKLVLPSNDSLQRYLVLDGATDPSDTIGKSKMGGIVVHIDNVNHIPGLKEDTAMQRVLRGSVVTTTTAPSDTVEKKVSNISISLNNKADAPFTYERSHFVFTNPLTGHVNMELPDVIAHHYSIKFFNDKGTQVMSIPRIPQSPVILDKRNFQHKGIYKFILKEDEKDMETGYITIY